MVSGNKRLVAYGLLVGFFVLGGIGGYALGKASAERDLARRLFDGDHRHREEVLLIALTSQLHLDSAQQDQVRAITQRYSDKRHTALREVASTCGQPLRALHDRMDAEISELLNPDQKPIFEAFVEKRRARFGTESQPKD